MIDQQPVRLPARGGGYTTSRSRAVDGVAGEVDETTLAVFADDAREQDQQRRHEQAEPIVAEVERIAAATDSLREQIANAQPGLISHEAKRRAHRIARDLSALASELHTL